MRKEGADLFFVMQPQVGVKSPNKAIEPTGDGTRFFCHSVSRSPVTCGSSQSLGSQSTGDANGEAQGQGA